MQDSGATFKFNQQPVLPLAEMLSPKKIKSVASLPIGAKVKSFKIDPLHSSERTQAVNIKLPGFVNLQESFVRLESEQIELESFDFASIHALQNKLIPGQYCSLGANKTFWWHWLVSASKKISLLVVLILFQSSTQASNLLEKAKIYADLDSQEAIAIPTSAQVNLKDSQASPFNRAISQAREIEVDSPFYPKAQVDINRWSETILDIAQGRAGEGNLAGAIAAAKLVPKNNFSTASVAQQATEAVENWQLRAQRDNLYQNYLTKAKTLIIQDRASSYNQAIGILRQIVPEAKEYQEAQSLIAQWNEQIYLIAKNRADRGDFKQAVEAAVLVSQDSSYHQLAKDSINMKIKSMYTQYLK